ncbi:MAG: glycerophosphodiester phosphodiesterase family protein, partial [Candidatus Korarchaeota archaeon]
MRVGNREFLVIGHRGSLPGRENTMEAFTLAKKLGADAIETDVRAVEHGKTLVLAHDGSLVRVANVPIKIINHTLEELRKYYPIPTVEELLSNYPDIINLEIKEKGVVDMLTRLVLKYNAVGRIVFSSFFPSVLIRVRKIIPNARIWFLIYGKNKTLEMILYPLARLFDK